MNWQAEWLAELEERREPNAIPGKRFEDWLSAELLKTWRHPGQPSYQQYLTKQAQRHGIDVDGIIGSHLVKLAKREEHVPTVATIAQAQEHNGRGRPRTHATCCISSCLSEHHSHGYCNNCYRGHRKGRTDKQLEVLADKRTARTIVDLPEPEVPLLRRTRTAHPLHARSRKQKQELCEQRIIETLAAFPGLQGEPLRNAVTRTNDEHLHQSFGAALHDLKRIGLVEQDRDSRPPTYHLTSVS